jgi:adenosylmethionine---8-amino-7-oxononanoate aminotransferase
MGHPVAVGAAGWHCSTMPKRDWAELLRYDREHVWHPYGPLPASMPPLPVTSAKGARIRLADGRELIDAMSSWWAAIWGYRHPALDGAVAGQLETMAHVMFGGLTHAPAIELAQRLAQMAPPGLDRVFFADSGSVSVEVAMKACLQYQRNAGHPERTRFLALLGGYHGDTFGAMSVCDPVGGMHHLFGGLLPEQVFLPRPPAGEGLDEVWGTAARAIASEHEGQLAAVIAEPLVQGAGGMWFYAPECVRVLREIADAHGALLVLDEIATGFGRTGKLWACETAGVSPDIMCVGKALSGGYLSLAATLFTTDVARVVSSGEANALLHGPTYMANALACAAALASTELLLSSKWEEKVTRIEEGLRSALSAAARIPGVVDVRCLGAIGVVQLDHPVDIPRATAAATSLGVWARPFRDLVYAMPPYVCDEDEVARIGSALVAAARAG